MAQTRKPARPRKAKAATRKPAKSAARKSAAKAPPKTKPRPARTKTAPRRERSETSGFDSLTKLIDHPLVADLLTVGAMAAVAAIADHNVKTRTGEAEPGSRKVVKAAGKAAASAIGRRLMTEVKEVKKASKPPGRESR